MARVEMRPSGGHTYAVVVEDVQDDQGAWRKKVIKSFGNASDEGNVEKAHQFTAAINAGDSLMTAHWKANKDAIQKALKVAVGAAMATAAVAWLFRDE